jgi:hypothetical protein
MAAEPSSMTWKRRALRVATALVLWALITPIVGFVVARIAVPTQGHAAIGFLYAAWAIGIVGFLVTAAYLLRPSAGRA